MSVLSRAVLVAVFALCSSEAYAFCGFYVGGADSSLFNDATMVVMMREGTTTVLSMQNDYSGPPEGFALVVPVPEVLAEDNVRTLPKSVFERVDQLAAPRLVEYWEQDPCYRPRRVRERSGGGRRYRRATLMRAPPTQNLGVTVEAEFAVGEYDIVILSAEDSGGLETWLHREQYNIPQGARRVLSPYVQLGTKFFVAKVDPQRVAFEDGHVVLSPLRMHYSSDTFSLPVRLGLLNSRGEQDLIVHVLAKAQRYEVANYPNVIVPTNLVVDDETRNHFGAFYNSLFDRVLQDNPGAVVTEYAWRATNCDPCPTTPLQRGELALLGADVIDGSGGQPTGLEGLDGKPARRAPPRPAFFGQGSEYTLTRLHYRYGPNDLQRDLVFRAAPAIIGGRGTPNAEGELQEKHAEAGGRMNNFQGRYVILHPWEGAVACANPIRGRWGGPPGGAQPTPRPALGPLRSSAPQTEVDLNARVATADHAFLAVTATPASDLSLGVLPDPEPEPEPEPQPDPQPAGVTTEPSAGGCASCSAGTTGGGIAFLFVLSLWMRRR